ncbi:MAG: type IX secretion system sortase PorU [Tannerellaceae bacterium]|nr:type IX secretion system sortase PorU [Tannerellaceae bacterium]
MQRLIYTLFILICCLASTSVWGNGNRYASGSVLATGKWHKIQIDTTGIYKITYAELRSMGFSDPEKVSIHGYGGWPLDEDFSKTYIDDLPATAVWRGSDYLLFYGRGPVKWEYVDKDGYFEHTYNPYSLYGYYFITDATGAKNMEKENPPGGALLSVTTFDDYVIHKVELESINSSGRELFGESFTTVNSRDVRTFSIPGILNENGKVRARFVGRPTSGTATVSLSINSDLIATGTVRAVSGNLASHIAGNEVLLQTDWTTAKSENNKINISYSRSGDANARLDYVYLQMKRALKVYDNVTFFRTIESIGNASKFTIQNATTGTVVFDVTDPLNPKVMETTLSSSELSFSIPAGALREFVAVQTDKIISKPAFVGEISNQNLHGLAQTDMVIISPSSFRSQALRLAEAHREKDNLSVTVVNPEEIYNEFSSGTPDATAYRRFMKMFYDRSSSEKDQPKYLLLFGDGFYDNRFITTEGNQIKELQNGMLLTYQTQESLSYFSYVIDNYFGVLGDTSGEIAFQPLHLGVGRIPVRNLSEATQVVDKIIAYMDNENTGSWKNNICFIADDGSSADSFTSLHMSHANALADNIEKNNPEYLVNRIYYDAFKKSAGGNTYPDVNTLVQKSLKNGIFILNYTGHGGTTGLSDEKVITQAEIINYNYEYLPLWITATCDFARFDARATSAGEDVFLSKSGGIGLLTTTRVAIAQRNTVVNEAFINFLFDKPGGEHLRLGDVLKETVNKIRIVGDTTRSFLGGFALIGDPALRLTYPKYDIQIRSINGEAVTGDTITLRALEKVTVEGEIYQPDGNPATNFNGMIYPTILDSQIEITTLDNNNTGNTFTYKDYSGTIFTGNESLENGKFSFTFTVPKDISYSGNEGKMVLYAYDETNGLEANGAFRKFKVGGTGGNIDGDTEGPEIRAIYLNDSTFVEGDKVNSTPFFIARVWDESGVNITGNSVGHDIMLIIDNDANKSYNLNGYYETVPNTGGEGLIKFLIPELEVGLHTAEFKIWDVYNNPTTYTFEFEVITGLKPVLAQIIASPVPARENVTFYLYHNRPGSTLDITIMVYDMTGRLQWQHEEKGSSDYSKPYTVTWDLSNNRGSRLRPGVYIYRAAIRSDKSKEATDAKKLIILGQ